MEMALSIAGKMAEWTFQPIIRELGYLLCFKSNIQELETRLNKLKAMKNDVQASEDAENRMGKTLGQTAMEWIENADKKIVESESVLNDKAELQKGCFSIKWCPNISLRFSLGRKGKKLSPDLNDLYERGSNFRHTNYDVPMPPINMSDYNGDACDFKSRSQIMENIIEKLRDEETMLIGIWGMGGIGKTTFAKQVLQKVQDSHKHLFDIQVITTVSSSPDFNKIQQEVAEMLGSFLLKGVDSKITRANYLRNTFRNKKVVVLLDDVGKEFDLNALGFPFTKSSSRCFCKIIYTSRTQGLWSAERNITKQEFSLDILKHEEALTLFKRKVNLSDDDIEFHWKSEIASQIVDECKGLPLALEVVGGTLVNKSENAWKDMLFKLQNQQLHNVKINNIVQTTYDFLEDQNTQHLFLLCCLFQEDEEISVETLYRYAVCLQLFKDMNDLNNISYRVYTLVDDLTRRSLLIKVKEYAVKMHDVARDVGISIAKHNGFSYLECDGEQENTTEDSEGGSKLPHTKMISILFRKKDIEFIKEFRGSNLELLRLDSSRFHRSNIKISGDLLKGEKNLKVLDIVSRYDKISEFPLFSSFSDLANLKMLSLKGFCFDMTTNLSPIRHLSSLEVLSLRDSTLKDLPNEISELTNLRLLDLTGCYCFISNGIISRLTNLQELYMWGGFNDWRLHKKDDGENHAAGLDELKYLHKLLRLELEVPNIKQVPRGMKLFSSSTLLKHFKIRIGGGEREGYIKFESGERQLWLENVNGNTSFFTELKVLTEKDITNLYLCADYGMWKSMWKNMHQNNFPSLKDIVLKQCGYLFPQSKTSLQTFEFGRCLRRIELYECNKMRHLCSTSISKNLTNLQILVLQECEMTEEVVSSYDKIEQLNKIEFNALKTLKLCDLSSLVYFCKRVNEINFHKLKTLELKGLKQFIFPTKVEIPCLEELNIISMPNIKTVFNIMPPSLQKLNIDNCDNFQYVDFSDSMVFNVISHLKSLTITRCKILKGVVGVTTGAEDPQRKPIEFPNLLTLNLESLDELTSIVIDINNLGNRKEKLQSALFYHDDYQVSFPCLQKLSINELPKINYIIGRKSEQISEIEEGHGREIQQPILLFPNLKRLTLANLDELVSFVGAMNKMDNKNQNALFYPDDDEISFSSFQSLSINELPKINYIVGRKERRPILLLFSNLKILNLHNLEELVSFVEVINNMDNNCKDQNALFHPEDDEVSIPCLDTLVIDGLPKINYIVGGKKHDHEVDDYDNVFSVLRRMNLLNLRNLIHIYEFNQPELGVLLFQNVKYIDVIDCGKLRYLFSEKIVSGTDQHFECIHIYDCGMMEVVMKTDEELTSLENVLPLLYGLRLGNLSTLKSFCNVSYKWELPSLEDLQVSGCPELKELSKGDLNSPRLDEFWYDNRKEENVKNIWKCEVNSALRHLSITKQEESVEENMDEKSEEGSNSLKQRSN